MKIVSSLCLTLALVVIGLAATGAVRTGDEVRDELEAVYAKIDKAVESKDLATLESLLGENYEKRRGGKTLNRDQTIAEMKKNFEAVKKIANAKTTIDKIEQVEGNQIVDYTETATITIVDADGKESTMTASSKARDWWVKGDDGKWLCVSAESIE